MKEELMLEDVLTLAHRAASEGECWSNGLHLNGAVVKINGSNYSIHVSHSYSGPTHKLEVEQDNIKLFCHTYLGILAADNLGFEAAKQINSLFYAKASEEAERKKDEQERNLKPIRESAIRDLKKSLRS